MEHEHEQDGAAAKIEQLAKLLQGERWVNTEKVMLETAQAYVRRTAEAPPTWTPEQAAVFEEQVVSRRLTARDAAGRVEGAAAQWRLDYWGRARW